MKDIKEKKLTFMDRIGIIYASTGNTNIIPDIRTHDRQHLK